MRKMLVLVIVALAFCTAASAAAVLCAGTVDNPMTSVAALIGTNATGGCYSQDKLFTNWSYTTTGTGSTPAANVGFNVILSNLPGIDIHGFSFAPTDNVWTAGFTLGYTISVVPPSSYSIVGATNQTMQGPLVNPATAITTLSNGVIFSLKQGTQTQSSLFTPVTSLTSSTVVNIPVDPLNPAINSYVASLEQDYVQQVQSALAEPMTSVLIGTGLVGLGLLRRRARKS